MGTDLLGWPRRLAANKINLSPLFQHSGRFHTDVPHARLRLIEDAGHMVHHLAPAEVMEAIDSIEQGATAGHSIGITSKAGPSVQ